MKKIIIAALTAVTLIPQVASAHCPLCTAGAGALAVLAVSLGVSSMIVGVLIGAFAIALSLWIARLPKKIYISYQKPLLATLVFFGTVIPIIPLVRDYAPLYLSLGGQYGTLLHNTYTINLFLAGVPLGVLAVVLAPVISRGVTKSREGKVIPFQGLGITFLLLILISLAIELLS